MRTSLLLALVSAAVFVASLLAPQLPRSLLVAAGAFAAAAVVAWTHRRSAVRAVVGGCLSAVGALAVDAFLAHVIGAGYAALGAALGRAAYPALMTAAFGIVALCDHPRPHAERES